MEDEEHGRIAEEEANGATANQSAAHPGDLTRNMSNYLVNLPYCYYIAIIGIVALPCALQLFCNCSVPDILVDVVASYAAFNVNVAPELLAIAKTPLSVGSLHV